MNKFIEVNLQRCTACRLCEFACSTHHFDEVNPAKSRIKVSIVAKDFFYYPNVCQQCGKVPCVEACPQEEALIRNRQTGAIEVNKEECIGCRMCIRACRLVPWGLTRKENLPISAIFAEEIPSVSNTAFTGPWSLKILKKQSLT